MERARIVKIQFRFEWYNAEKTVMRYIAENQWTWRDYHACVRASIFSMHQHPNAVHSIIDLRESQRTKMPAGLAAHAQTFGKRLTPALSGQAIVLGLAQADWQQLPLSNDGTLHTSDGQVHYADDETALALILADLVD